MTIGNQSNMVIYQDQFYTGFVESVQSNLDVFNAASKGTITFSTAFHRGQQKERAFWLKSNGIYHRDPASNSTIVPISISADDVKSIKVKKGDYYSFTSDSLRDQGLTEDTMLMAIGEASGGNIVEQWRESGISALVGAYGLAGLAAGADQLVYDGTAGTMSTATLIAAMPLMGDKQSRVKALVMHSKVYWDLVGSQAASSTADGVADLVVMSGTPETLGKPVIVVDSEALIVDNGSAAPNYHTFALVENALTIEESVLPKVLVEEKTGFANIVIAVQYEFNYTIGLKGISYESATKNPTDAQLGDSSNWQKTFTSRKDLPGIMITTL
jgi:hypothetical protein